jgi:hypothetical protein
LGTSEPDCSFCRISNLTRLKIMNLLAV